MHMCTHTCAHLHGAAPPGKRDIAIKSDVMPANQCLTNSMFDNALQI